VKTARNIISQTEPAFLPPEALPARLILPPHLPASILRAALRRPSLMKTCERARERPIFHLKSLRFHSHVFLAHSQKSLSRKLSYAARAFGAEVLELIPLSAGIFVRAGRVLSDRAVPEEEAHLQPTRGREMKGGVPLTPASASRARPHSASPGWRALLPGNIG